MALFGRDYDRDYGYRGDRMYGAGYRGSMYASYDRDYGYYGNNRGYDRENYKSRWQTDYGDPFGDREARTPMRMIRGEYNAGYDRDYGYRGYDRDLNDRGFRGLNNRGYDRDYYEANPMTYDPGNNRGYGARRGTYMDRDRTYNAGYRNDSGYGNRGYDRGWF